MKHTIHIYDRYFNNYEVIDSRRANQTFDNEMNTCYYVAGLCSAYNAMDVDCGFEFHNMNRIKVRVLSEIISNSIIY